MPDQLQSIVQRMIDAGESEDNIATVITHFKTQAPVAPAAKPDPFQRWKDAAGGAPAGELWQNAKNHPVQTGATIGAGLLTAGTGGPLLQIARAGLGAAGGAGYGLLAKGDGTRQGNAQEIAKQGAIGAAGQAGGQMLASGLQMAGRGLYRAAALPIQKMNKYGDLIREGLENAIPVSKSGVEDAKALLASRAADKTAALAAADQRVSMLPRQIAADAGTKMDAHAGDLRRAGLPDPSKGQMMRLSGFVNNNPAGVKPSELDAIKGTLDDTIGGAYKKLRMREPITPTERYGVEMTQAQSRALEQAVPDYKALNKGKMDAEGLRQMIARRIGPGGGNQGMENALTMLGGFGTVPARLAMLPPVLSRAAIATHQAGTTPMLADSFRTALIAALSGKKDQP